MPDSSTPPDPLHPPVPSISARDEPRFGSVERKGELAAAFHDQGEDYDRLRPEYPGPVLEAILARLPGERADSGATSHDAGGAATSNPHDAGPISPTAVSLPPRPRAIDLGAGTGKLSWALVERGLDVTAVDTSRAMLAAALRRVPSPAAGPTPTLGTFATHCAPAEATDLPAASAELVTVAQAWHWFEARAASEEVTRLLAPGGVLALVWNMLDVTIPWVHRLSRIMHAGDIHREEFLPTVGAGLTLLARGVHEWQDPMPTQDIIDLARTRSYVLTASEERRDAVLANLDWYLHEHLGHARGDVVGLPYRTDWFLYRPTKT